MSSNVGNFQQGARTAITACYNHAVIAPCYNSTGRDDLAVKGRIILPFRTKKPPGLPSVLCGRLVTGERNDQTPYKYEI